MPDTLLGGIAINEILVDPNSATNNFDTDGNGAARGRDEFLELVNTSASAIDISGLELWDQGRDNWFTFPPGTVLQAGAVAVVVRDVQNGGSLPVVTGDNLAFDANFGSNVFNNGGDNIVVYDPANDEYIQATYNGDTQLDPTTASGFSGFSSTAARSGPGEDFGNDIDGISLQRLATGYTNSDPPTPGSLICFAEGAQIETDKGFLPVEALRAGHHVRTLDRGVQRIVGIFVTPVSATSLRQDETLRPIALPAINGFPPLQVSRQHRVLVSGKTVARMFNTRSVLIPAKDLIGAGTATMALPNRALRYFHILLAGHHILNANGYATESLFPGPEAMRTLSHHMHCGHVSGVAMRVLENDTPPARLFVTGSKARRLVVRLHKNGHRIATPFATTTPNAFQGVLLPSSVISKRHESPWRTAQHATSRHTDLLSTNT